MSDWETTLNCPVCDSDECVPPAGLKDAPILIVAEFPGNEEIKRGKPLCGNSGTVLKTELGKLGIDMKGTRLCNLWPHAPNKNQGCLKHGASQVIAESVGRKAILLLGADVVKYFCGQDIGSVMGLQVTSNLLFAPLIVAAPNPGIVFRSSIGELRLSLTKFLALYRRMYECG